MAHQYTTGNKPDGFCLDRRSCGGMFLQKPVRMQVFPGQGSIVISSDVDPFKFDQSAHIHERTIPRMQQKITFRLILSICAVLWASIAHDAAAAPAYEGMSYTSF